MDLEAPNGERSIEAVARSIVDSNRYMTLATADESGQPWVTPVWFAPDGYANYYWVSAPEARHSRNLSVRADLAGVIFDSRAAIGTGQAVYLEATARELEAAEVERGIEVFSRVSQDQGAQEWSVEEVLAPAAHRLYLTTTTRQFVLDPQVHGVDERTEVSL
jgi:nitroimidazol reductase NimA-like FMN-containing flavoprotein (pyridoxamine 5'-phosphate oxidase superfamily)